MSVKSLVCLASGDERDIPAIKEAAALARTAKAVLRVVHVVPPPIAPELAGFAGYGLASVGDGTTIDMIEADNLQAAKQARQQTEAVCKAESLPFSDVQTHATPGQPFAWFRSSTGRPRDIVAHEAYTTDLIIAAHDARQGVDFDYLLAGLFEAGRPVLLVPRTGPVSPSKGFAGNIVFAWDGSRAAAKALREAVPHMLRAKCVYLLRVVSDAGSDDVDEADVLGYLASHCIIAEVIRAEKGSRKTGEVILDKAQQLGAELLIMGAYGRGHTSEMLLGGVTDYILKHSPLPLLLAR
jgi:nucleotide-binding universal stress UspA family protein